MDAAYPIESEDIMGTSEQLSITLPNSMASLEKRLVRVKGEEVTYPQVCFRHHPNLKCSLPPLDCRIYHLYWDNYWATDIDADYQLLAVSEPKRQYLWILSRIPEVSAKTYDELVARLEKTRFDLKKLGNSKQTKP